MRKKSQDMSRMDPSPFRHSENTHGVPVLSTVLGAAKNKGELHWGIQGTLDIREIDGLTVF